MYGYNANGYKLPGKASKSQHEDRPVHPSVLTPTLTDAEFDQIKGWNLDMSVHAEPCVDRYCGVNRYLGERP